MKPTPKFSFDKSEKNPINAVSISDLGAMNLKVKLSSYDAQSLRKDYFNLLIIQSRTL